jgi:hypothetical protein
MTRRADRLAELAGDPTLAAPGSGSEGSRTMAVRALIGRLRELARLLVLGS